MTRIHLYAHPLAPAAPQVFEAGSLALWLLEHFGERPTVTVQIFSGEPCAENEITRNTAALIAGDAPDYTVLQSPAGFDPVTIGLIISVVLAVAVIILTPKPEMPNSAINRTQASPNNALGNRENKVRLLERVEDIYGTVKSIPSLMMPPYIKYSNHSKFETGYYCVGRGYHSLTELRDGDTLIADITGASASVYDPFTSPNSGHAPVLQVGAAIIDDVLTARRAIEVDGINLKAANQLNLPASGVYTFTPDAAGALITQAAKNPNFNAVVLVGALVNIAMAAQTTTTTGAATVTGATRKFTDTSGLNLFAALTVNDFVTTSGFVNAANNGSFQITSKPTANEIVTLGGNPVNESATAAVFSVSRDYSGSYSVINVYDGVIRLATVNTAAWRGLLSNVTCSVLIAGSPEYTSWVTLPDVDRTQVWVNVLAPNGMYNESGGKSTASVNFSLEIERLSALLVPTGQLETVAGNLSGATSDERAQTLEQITAWTGPARVRMRRTSDYDYTFSGTVQDEIKWFDLYSVSPVSKTEFGNKTTIHTITQATTRATAVKSRQLNCIASRRLPVYNGSTFSGAFNAAGLLISGTIAPTSKLVDIIAAVSVDPKIGARDLATEIDLAQIYAVQQQLDAWNIACGQFNYTFDSDNTSFEETLVLIANAGFCVAYRQNGKIRLSLDQAQAASTALFTHRNKKPNAETITRRFASDAQYDGVEFTYVDPATQQAETITLPLSGDYTKLKKFEIAGIRSYEQAWLRANRELAKLLGQRLSLETTTTLDARSLLPNARVDVVDNTRFKSYDGEVVGQSGLELTLSRDVAFTLAAAHSIVLMRRDGSLQSITATAGSAPNKVLLQSLPTEALVTVPGEAGIRTIYSFAADSARGAMAWLVQEIDISDPQYVQLRAINYSASYYAADYAAIPVKATVIN